MKLLRTLIAAVTATVGSYTHVSAQRLDVGASLGLSCQGTEGNYCGETARNLMTGGPFAGVWFGSGLEVVGRVVWMRQPAPVSSLLLGDALWHFRTGARVRPFLGGGVGGYRVRSETNGPRIRASFAAGLSVLCHPRIRLQAGFRQHNVGLVDEPLSEGFAGFAYRLWD